MAKNQQVNDEIFQVYVTFKSGEVHVDTKYTSDMSKIRSAIQRLVNGPGRVVTKEVKVTDGQDIVCLHIIDGKVVYPTPGVIKEAGV